MSNRFASEGVRGVPTENILRMNGLTFSLRDMRSRKVLNVPCLFGGLSVCPTSYARCGTATETLRPDGSLLTFGLRGVTVPDCSCADAAGVRAGPGSSKDSWALAGGVGTKLPYCPSEGSSWDTFFVGMVIGGVFLNGWLYGGSSSELSESGLESAPRGAGEPRREVVGPSFVPSRCGREKGGFGGAKGDVEP